MALFSGESTQVTTPDGRTLVLPVEVAAQFSGLRPPPGPAQDLAQAPAGGPGLPPTGPGPGPGPGAPPPLPGGGSPAWTPADTAALGAATPPPDATSGPVTSPAQVPQPGPPRAPQGPVTDPGQDQGVSSYRPTPAQPIKTADQAKQAAATAMESRTQAIESEKAANIEAANVEAEKSRREGAILAERNALVQKQLEDDARRAQENRDKLDSRIAARDEYAAKIANTKIDRSVDHPVWAAISLALGTIGGAMQQKAYGGQFHNIAFDTIMQGIDRKVDAQMKDLENQRMALGQMNTAIGEQRQYGLDDLAERSARREAAIQQAKMKVEEMAAQMKAPTALANAHIINTRLDQESQKEKEAFADRSLSQINVEEARKQQAQQHAQTIAATIRGQNLTYQAHREQMEATEREKMAEVSARLLSEGKKEAAAKADKAAQTVLYDPRTRDVMLNPTGIQKFADADRLEAAARQRQNPAEAQALRQRAADLRDSARLNDGVHASDPKVAEKLKPKIGTAQQVTDEIGDVVKMLETDPEMWSREQWAGIATKLGNVANVYQKVIGERISVRAFEQTMKHILEFDPDSLFDRAASQGRALESLKQLKGIVANDINTELGQEGIKTNWRPVAKGEDATSLDINDKTAFEKGQDENPGLLQRIGARIITGGTKSYDDFGFQDQATADALTQPGSIGGLSPAATARVQMLAQKADQVGDAERAKIIDAIKAPIVAGGLEGGRASVASGVLEVLRTTSPRLYAEVVNQLPAEQADTVRRIDAMRAKVTPNLPPPPKGPSGFDPNDPGAEGRAEEAKRKADLDAWARKQGLRIGGEQAAPYPLRGRGLYE